MTKLIPIPGSQKELLENGHAGNFSLYFSRMTRWRENGESGVEKDESAVARFEKAYRGREQAGRQVLMAVDDRLRKSLLAYYGRKGERGYSVFEITARTSSPLVSGLGAFHPTETGLVLDRNSGLPYLPASSLKGVLRLAMAVLIAEEGGVDKVDADDERLVRWFGTSAPSAESASRGRLIVFDSFPKGGVKMLGLDIVNPHYGSYYSGKNGRGPVETDNPVPVKFLRVEPGTEFIFRCMVPKDIGADIDSKVSELFTVALTRIGLGAKSSVGYGFFEDMKIKNGAALVEACKPDWERTLDASYDQVSNWKTLKDLMENPIVKDNNSAPEVATRIAELATRVAFSKKAKWDADNTRYVQGWLAPAQMGWEGPEGNTLEPENELSAEQAALMSRVENMQNFGSYSKIQPLLPEMGIECLRKLKVRLKDFGCDSRRARSDKKRAWKEVVSCEKKHRKK